MTKKTAKKDRLEVPAGFPENVNPSQANIKAYEDQLKADQKAADKGEEPTGERVGVGIVG